MHHGVDRARRLPAVPHWRVAPPRPTRGNPSWSFNDFAHPFGGRSYLFEVEFRLPPQEEYGQLLFHPPNTYGGDVQENRGWRLTVFDDHHHELPTRCQDWNHGSVVTEHVEGLTRVQHSCLHATATDEDYETMSKARFLRVTLIGNYRQLWLDLINVYFRAITDVIVAADGNLTSRISAAPPPPPPQQSPKPSPPGPLDPPASPPTAAYTFYSLQAPTDWQNRVLTAEPCGLSAGGCAAHAGVAGATGFVLSAAGCCYPISGPVGGLVEYGFGKAGVGVF